MKKLFITLSILLTSAVSFAQVSNVMYSSTLVPQAGALNPAFFPKNTSIYIALPGINPQLQSPLSFNDIFQYDAAAQQTNINLNNLVSSLAEDGNINLDLNVHGAGLGLKLGRGQLSLAAQVKANMHLGIPSGLMTFLNEGNYSHRGEKLELVDGSLLNVQAYSELSVAYGRELIDGLTVGARVKILNGLLSANTAGSSLALTTAEDLSSIQATLATRVQYSSFLDSNLHFNPNNLITNNWGFGFDLGAHYEMGILEFSASILDLGKGITWNDNVKNIIPKNNEEGVFVFEGIDLTSLITNGSIDSNLAHTLTDSLSSLLQYETVDGQSFTTKVPTKVNAAVMVHPIAPLRAGVMFHGEMDRYTNAEDAFTKLRSNTTLLGNLNLNDWVELMVSASIVGDGDHVSWFNPGFGINLSLARTFQVYGMVDYISNLRLVEAKSLNLAVGINLLLGNGSKK